MQARPNALEPRLLRPGLTHVDLCIAMSRSLDVPASSASADENSTDSRLQALP